MPPISIMGLGLKIDSSLMRDPNPPAKMTAFISSYFNDDNMMMR